MDLKEIPRIKKRLVKKSMNADGGAKETDINELIRKEKVKAKKKIAREKKKVRAANTKVPKLPRRIIHINNKEKDSGWMESYKPNQKNLARIPHSFRMIVSGSVGHGKTNICKQVVLAHQAGSRKFKKLYIVSCSPQCSEWDDMEHNGLYTELPDPEMFDGKEKCCLVLDDYEFEKNQRNEARKLATLFRYSSTHRNLSIICSYQIFCSIPTVARKCANIFLIYKPIAKLDTSTIANRVGMDKEDLEYIFNHICTDRFDFLVCDLIPGSPAPLRKNLYYPIKLNEKGRVDQAVPESSNPLQMDVDTDSEPELPTPKPRGRGRKSIANIIAKWGL